MRGKKEDPYDPKYREAGASEQTPEQKLVQALASQGRGSKDLMYLLSAMRSPTPQEQRAAMFTGEPVYSAPGRAFRGPNDMVMYQPANEAGELEGTGRIVSSRDVRTITGGRGELSSRGEIEVANMLRDPAVMRFFMDVYGEAGKARKPNVTSLKTPKRSSKCEIEVGSGVPLSDECAQFARNMGKD